MVRDIQRLSLGCEDWEVWPLSEEVFIDVYCFEGRKQVHSASTKQL